MKHLITLLLCFYSANLLWADNNAQTMQGYVEQLQQLIYKDPQQAVQKASELLVILEDSNVELETEILICIGRSYSLLGLFDMAFENYYAAEKACPPSNQKNKAIINIHIGSSYRSLKDFDKSIQHFNKAHDIYISLNDSLGISNYYNAIGLFEVNRENYKLADSCFHKALAISRVIGNKREIARTLNNLCLYEGNVPQQIEMLNEAIEINKLANANWSLAENYNNLGVLYYFSKEYQQAIEQLKIAKQYAESIQAKELICDNYRYKSWVNFEQGYYEVAYNNLLKLYNLEQEIMSASKLRRIEMNEAAKRFETQQIAMTLQQQHLEIQTLRKEIWLIISILLGVLVITVYLIFRTRYKRRLQLLKVERKLAVRSKQLTEVQLEQAEFKQKNMSEQLEYQKNELVNFAFWIKNRNDILDKIRSMIKDGTKNKDLNSLADINNFILQSQWTKNEHEFLNNEIDRIGNEFTILLTKKHPDLSKNEKKLASLLRIDLSTKEIALILDSSPHAINMARYRLRKRLNLESDEKLNEYMKSI